MNNQELIKEVKNLKYSNASKRQWIDRELVLGLIEQLDEPQKVVVEQFVADWYEKHKDSFDYNLWEYLTSWEEQEPSDFKNWINDEYNTFQTLVNMHQFGYTVEKEKRYQVKMKNAYYNKHPQFLCETDNGIFWTAVIDLRKTKFTRKELKEAGFGWVFNCPGIEVEEVE